MTVGAEGAAAFPDLFSPLELLGQMLRNRIAIALWDERNEPALRALADGVHRHGARCMTQMTHMGRRGTSTMTGIPLRAPSDLPEGVHL
jgi:2,4-dienoyl-CoA reductase-like NADH-dependent reductase (Old Yellow Enzyme family)